MAFESGMFHFILIYQQIYGILLDLYHRPPLWFDAPAIFRGTEKSCA
jgi:hypothetical protein